MSAPLCVRRNANILVNNIGIYVSASSCAKKHNLPRMGPPLFASLVALAVQLAALSINPLHGGNSGQGPISALCNCLGFGSKNSALVLGKARR